MIPTLTNLKIHTESEPIVKDLLRNDFRREHIMFVTFDRLLPLHLAINTEMVDT